MIQMLASGFAACIGLLSSLGMLVILAAGLANADAAHLQQGKWMAIGISLVQVLALGAAIWLMVQRRCLHASIAGLVPLLVVIVLLIVLVRIEW